MCKRSTGSGRSAYLSSQILLAVPGQYCHSRFASIDENMSAQPLIVDPLFFFNQRASQLESTVAWVEVPTGLSHSRQWSVECLGRFLCP